MSKIPRNILKKLYKSMLRMRLCEESFVPPILDGTIRCPVHLYTGEEAIAAAFGEVLTKEDYVFGNHRSHGHFLMKGGSMRELVAEVYCKESGCSKGRGGSMHLIDPDSGMLGSAPIVGGTIPLALGAALASHIRKDRRVTVSFFGDGATGEGVLCESLNFAALNKLPIIFACENNYYSTHLPIDEIRVNRNIFGIAKPFGVMTDRVDGNDILKVFEHVKKAVKVCKAGNGPVFIEFTTYRQHGHVGPDDNVQGAHTDIRPKNEIKKWLKKDPIVKFKNYLLKEGSFEQRELEAIRQEVSGEVKDAFDFALKSSYPREKELHINVFK